MMRASAYCLSRRKPFSGVYFELSVLTPQASLSSFLPCRLFELRKAWGVYWSMNETKFLLNEFPVNIHYKVQCIRWPTLTSSEEAIYFACVYVGGRDKLRLALEAQSTMFYALFSLSPLLHCKPHYTANPHFLSSTFDTLWSFAH